MTPKIAVLLVGGRGTRLRSVIADRPKVLAAASGKPFLSYLLDQLADAGVTRVILCVGYRGAEIQAAFGEGYAGMRLEYSQETTPLGTGGAIRLAWPLIASERFIAMNGDSFCEVSLGDLWVSHHARQAKATLVLTPKADTARYGRVSLCSDGLISGFEEKGGTPGGGWVNAGIYVLGSEITGAIPSGRAVSLEHEIFPSWVGHGLYGYQSWGRFLDIGTPKSYAQADALFPAK